MSGPEVIKLEPIIALYFEFETVLMFYNLGPYSKLYDTLLVFMKDCFIKSIVETNKIMQNFPACKDKNTYLTYGNVCEISVSANG